jgi:nucleotide-binding universal stress UspA family protein
MKILVPVDGSDQARQAAQWASRRAAESDGTVTLLHVHAIPATEAMGMAKLSREQISAIEERHATPSFEGAREVMDIEPADTMIAMGDPGAEIVGIAKKHGFEHIVMGSRGLSPLRELLLGSVSEHVIRKSHCPVTIVR